MKHQLFGQQIHIATGGRAFDNKKTCLFFIHGSGQNHLTWVLQTRYFAYRGYGVLAPDFPGHGLSGGTPFDSIEAMADWVISLLDSLGVQRACLVGHSQGCLVALDTAARYPERVSHIGLIAGALAIPVNDQLLSLSDTALTKAIGVMTSWGHGAVAHMYDNTQPGHSFIGYGNRLMEMNDPAALRNDLTACNNFNNGKDAAAKIVQPALVLIAGADRMTPAKFGKAMANSLANSHCQILAGAGHMLPAEQPAAVNHALRHFLPT